MISKNTDAVPNGHCICAAPELPWLWDKINPGFNLPACLHPRLHCQNSAAPPCFLCSLLSSSWKNNAKHFGILDLSILDSFVVCSLWPSGLRQSCANLLTRYFVGTRRHSNNPFCCPGQRWNLTLPDSHRQWSEQFLWHVTLSKKEFGRHTWVNS